MNQPSSIMIAISTTQLVVGLLIAIVTLVLSGVAFGRLSERQKNDRTALDSALKTMNDGIAHIAKAITEMQKDHGSLDKRVYTLELVDDRRTGIPDRRQHGSES
jgi:ABC-type uncharacterized transport system permease subunit